MSAISIATFGRINSASMIATMGRIGSWEVEVINDLIEFFSSIQTDLNFNSRLEDALSVIDFESSLQIEYEFKSVIGVIDIESSIEKERRFNLRIIKWNSIKTFPDDDLPIHGR